MPIKVTCSCGRQLIVPESRAGRTVDCPKCGARVIVPGERGGREQEAEKERRKQTASVEGMAVAAVEAPVVIRLPVENVEPVIAPPPVEKLAPPVVAATHMLPPPAPAPPLIVTPPVIEAVAPPPVAASPVAPPKTIPPVPSPAPIPRAGYRPDADKLTAAYVLSMLLVCLGVFSMVPGVLDVVRYLGDPDSDVGFVGRWAFAVFFLGGVHLAYALYIGQLPDWSSSWVLTVATLLQAALYAAVLTALYLAGGKTELVDALDLGPHVDNGRARAWCFIMLCATGLVAYFCGRVSIRWRRAFVLVRDAYRR